MDIRIGRVLKIWNHPEAEKLYCEEVDIGGEIRTIATGVRDHIPIT